MAIPLALIPAILNSTETLQSNANGVIVGVKTAQADPFTTKILTDKDVEIAYLRDALRLAQQQALLEQQAHAETRRLLAAPKPLAPVDQTRTETETSRMRSEADESSHKEVTGALPYVNWHGMHIAPDRPKPTLRERIGRWLLGNET